MLHLARFEHHSPSVVLATPLFVEGHQRLSWRILKPVLRHRVRVFDRRFEILNRQVDTCIVRHQLLSDLPPGVLTLLHPLEGWQQLFQDHFGFINFAATQIDQSQQCRSPIPFLYFFLCLLDLFRQFIKLLVGRCDRQEAVHQSGDLPFATPTLNLSESGPARILQDRRFGRNDPLSGIVVDFWHLPEDVIVQTG